MPTCKYCSSSDTYEDPTTGQLACEKCGFVLDEVAISSEVDFHEDGHRSGDRYSYRDSRALTLSNSRRQIRDMATTLRMTDDHIERAQLYYKLALEKNFTQGRAQSHVVAACLYLVCRTEKTPHILLDFCDAIQPPVNVYVLGSTYLKLCKALNLGTKNLPVIDPSIYIHKYASQLEFGDQTNKVAETANRVVQRMCRDWIQTGRRPIGLVAAALLLAARYHNFSRTVREVVDVVRICDVTLRKRLSEFSVTGSGALTLDEFLAIELDEECDPPAFTRARLTAQDKLMLEASGLSEADVTRQMKEVMDSTDFVEAASSCTAVVPVKRRKTAPVALDDVLDESDNLSDVDDDEIEAAILNADEVEIRTQLWTELNREYLEQQEEKKRLAEENAAMGITTQKRKRRRKANTGVKKAPAATAIEAVTQMLEEKKLSKKINYDALHAGLDEAPLAIMPGPGPGPEDVPSAEPVFKVPRPVKPPPVDNDDDDILSESEKAGVDEDEEDEEAIVRQINDDYYEDEFDE